MLFTLNFVSYVKVYKPFLIRKSQVTALCFVRGLTLKSACFNPIEYLSFLGKDWQLPAVTHKVLIQMFCIYRTKDLRMSLGTIRLVFKVFLELIKIDGAVCCFTDYDMFDIFVIDWRVP